MQKEYIEDLKSCEDFQVDSYQLVNNYGYHIDYKGHRFDLRHWLNVYGERFDYWDIWCNTNKQTMSKHVKRDITQKDLINLMEEILKGV